MGKTSYYFSGDKDARANYAIAHTEEMNNKYSNEIKYSVDNTICYDGFNESTEHIPATNILVADTDSVSAIKVFNTGRTAVLNFASYKNPGGMFINGSKAQEECLCASSFLYNVLLGFDDSYYEYNRKNLNRGLYKDRALYSPDVYFFIDDTIKKADVITCAAPNAGTFLRYNPGGENKQLNYNTLYSRIRFVLNIAEVNRVDNLILGAYGCGVFGQDPKVVANIFKELLQIYYFNNVVFAIPAGFHSDNYEAFKSVFTEGE